MHTHKRFIVDWPLQQPDPVEQPSLFDPYPAERAPTNRERWQAFKSANPWVFPKLLSMAQAEYQAGKRRIATKRLVENLRAEVAAGAPVRADDRPWAFDNSFTCHIADDLAAADARLASRIERRKRHVA